MNDSKDLDKVIAHVERIIANLNQHWHSIQLLLSHVSQPLTVDDRGLANTLANLRQDLFTFSVNFKECDLGQTLAEIKYMNNRLNNIEKEITQIKENGMKHRVELSCRVDGYEMVKKPKSYEEDNLEESEDDKIKELLNSLLPREGKAVILRFGLLGKKKHTYEAMGKEFKVGRERASQIYNRAIRKLRHPSRIEFVRKINNFDIRKVVGIQDND
jgi:hypothetical protein